LAEMEKQHRAVLEMELRYLINNDKWFDEEAGTSIQLVGP